MVLFLTLFKVVLAFESVDDLLMSTQDKMKASKRYFHVGSVARVSLLSKHKYKFAKQFP